MRSMIVAAMLLMAGACAGTVAGGASVEQTIRALEDEERVAALNRDIPAMERLWSADFTVNAPNNQVVTGRKAVLDTFVHGNIINFTTFDRRVEFFRIDGGFAIVMGEETVVPAVDAPNAGLRAGQTVRRRFTNIWKDEAGTWRLYWRHANVMPPR